jgi:hypothetical protein
MLSTVLQIGQAGAGVFPGAVGFGTDTPAGKGGRVLKVTSLNASGPGSLVDALRAKGPRIIVFEVGGVIDLAGRSITISEPFLTVAGQTAPSPGITIIRGGMSITAHDVLIRHIRVRPGDAGRAKRSGWSPDGIATSAACNVVIDHCSISWSVDENLSASGPRHEGPDKTSHDITFSNCIIAECLSDSSHEKGRHSKGSLIHDYCTDIAVIGNLYAHNVSRNPYFKAFATGVVVNNVIYNPGSRAIQLDWPASEWRDTGITPQDPRISVVGNVMIHGADTRGDLALVCRKGDAWLRDNLAIKRDGSPAELTSGEITRLQERPSWPEGLRALPAGRVIDYVTANAGARPKDRDDVDRRIIRDFRRRKGQIIDSQAEVGGYPNPRPIHRKLNAPNQNVDQWLARFAAEVE